MNLTSPKEVREFLRENGLSPLKKFGQNFLVDGNIITKIAGSVPLVDGNVLEIGTGLGALTEALAKRAERVVSVEVDKGLIKAHGQTLAGHENITVLESDILKTDLKKMRAEYFDGQPFDVCGNLPYYITSKILLHVLESGAGVTSLTAMVQKEVAARLAANAGDADYGALTASCRYYADAEVLFTVSKNCFYPAPDVDSAILFMDLTRGAFDVDRQSYVKTVRTAFAMRRKTLLNNLRQVAPPARVEQALAMLSIEPAARAQDLSPRQFAELAKALFGE
ncbi:16S rRNA (adenine(1518)-N(6)/adenine(1519)-N(6))-dimethyltransferase RsmA [Christensenellaceae bacterium OttesenSCG-928-K19]|nr:16S rRNA (adenine(1518)-N(6)/adenine(1519)-N(6))-dimethyltransferase RsmA [Christensenellaceae bacterium OttesenSCG-928-K19]